MWKEYSYINLLHSMNGFEDFVLNAVHDKQLMDKLQQHQSLEGRGTVAEHMRGLAKGLAGGYRDGWHAYSHYNGPRSAPMHDLLPEERYAFYQSAIFYADKEAASYLKSYGPEYDRHIQSLQKNLSNDSALRNHFSRIPSYAGGTALDYVRREAKEAQWREQHAMHHATYRLVQETSTLENLKAQYSQTLDHDLCSPEIANRIEQRVQALEQLERKNHALVVQDYGLSQQARDVARSWGMDVHEFQHFTGNMVQQQLHSELVSLANNVGDVTQRMREVGIDSKQVESLIGSYAKTAHEYNKTVQHIDKAFAASDVCWGLVDYCHAAVQGVGDGVYNVAQVIAHTVDAAPGMARGACVLPAGVCRLAAMGTWVD